MRIRSLPITLPITIVHLNHFWNRFTKKYANSHTGWKFGFYFPIKIPWCIEITHSALKNGEVLENLPLSQKRGSILYQLRCWRPYFRLPSNSHIHPASVKPKVAFRFSIGKEILKCPRQVQPPTELWGFHYFSSENRYANELLLVSCDQALNVRRDIAKPLVSHSQSDIDIILLHSSPKTQACGNFPNYGWINFAFNPHFKWSG